MGVIVEPDCSAFQNFLRFRLHAISSPPYHYDINNCREQSLYVNFISKEGFGRLNMARSRTIRCFFFFFAHLHVRLDDLIRQTSNIRLRLVVGRSSRRSDVFVAPLGTQQLLGECYRWFNKRDKVKDVFSGLTTHGIDVNDEV